MQTQDLVREITQSILALVVVVGGGFIIYSQPQAASIPVVAALMGGVVTYYFTQVNTANLTARIAADLKARQGTP